MKRLYIPLPNALARRKIVQNLMEGQSHQLSNEEVCAICEQSEGKSPKVTFFAGKGIMLTTLIIF